MLHDSILAGITRESVIAIAKEKGLEVVEQMIPKDFLRDGLESGKITCLFATGTAAAITFIRTVDIDGKLYHLNSDSDTIIQNIKLQLDNIKFARSGDHAHWNYIL